MDLTSHGVFYRPEYSKNLVFSGVHGVVVMYLDFRPSDLGSIPGVDDYKNIKS